MGERSEDQEVPGEPSGEGKVLKDTKSLCTGKHKMVSLLLLNQTSFASFKSKSVLSAIFPKARLLLLVVARSQKRTKNSK